MSGFLERVLDDWLTSADERGYQIAFAAQLSASGQMVKYVSPHSTGEHGKDIITVDRRRKIHAYQLKVGDITMGEWRKIRGEVLECATVRVDRPGLAHRIADHAYLVLTGRVSDVVAQQLSLINAEHRDRNYPEISLIERDELVSRFSGSFDAFLPQNIETLHDLVRCYLDDPAGPPDKPRMLAAMSSGLQAANAQSPRKARRALANFPVIAQFVDSHFRKQANHVSSIEVWTLAASAALRSSQGLQHVSSVLDRCQEALSGAADALWREANRRPNLLEGRSIAESFIHVYRKIVILGYLGACLNFRTIQGLPVRDEAAQLISLVERELPYQPWGEATWNFVCNLVLALRHDVRGTHLAEEILAQWVNYACPTTNDGHPTPHDPYWTLQEELRAQTQAQPPDGRNRARVSYTATNAIDLLVRAGRRQRVARLWRAFSKYDAAEVVPDLDSDLLGWELERGSYRQTQQPIQGSWAALQARANRPGAIEFDSRAPWLLPFYLCAFPHRTQGDLALRLEQVTRPTW